MSDVSCDAVDHVGAAAVIPVLNGHQTHDPMACIVICISTAGIRC